MIIEGSGYSLPADEERLARILHANNSVTISTVTPTPAAATGYSADAVKNALTYEKYKPTSGTSASLALATTPVSTIDCVCIAGHTLSGRYLTIQSGTKTHVNAQLISDNGPIMVLITDDTSTSWNIAWTGGSAEVAVISLGQALVMQRPFYAGFAPARTNRQTSMIGNISESGQFLGRTVTKTMLAASYQWQHLGSEWADANLPDLILALETAPFFLAWRPGGSSVYALNDDGEAVDFGWTTGPVGGPPTTMGIRDLRSFGFEATVLSYE